MMSRLWFPILGDRSTHATSLQIDMITSRYNSLWLHMILYDLSDPSDICLTRSDTLWYMFYVSELLQCASYLIVLHCTSSATVSVPQTPLGTFNMSPSHCNDTCWTHVPCPNAARSWYRSYWNNKESLAIWYIGLCIFHFSFTSTDFVLYHLPYVFLMLASWLISYLGTFSF
jgi:hypothetical protein